MPSMINGVGTNYVGKQNLDRNYSVCEQCHYHGELLSYDTRLWFVVLLIPIIPLGKKRILDYCPQCTAHKMLVYDEWQKIGSEVLTEAQQEFAKAPNDPDISIKYHATLDYWNQKEEAKTLAEKMNSKFKRNFDIQMYLGTWYERKGKAQAADTFFEQALSVDPDNPEAKRAVAMGYIENGEMEKAEELLAYMKTKGEHQDFGVLFMLADAYQKKNLHNKALGIFKIICRDFPEAARKDKSFRKAVKKSEKMSFGTQSILPPPPFNWLKIIVPVVIFIAAITIFQTNLHIKTHRTLYVVNGLHAKTSIKLPGRSLIKLRPNSIKRSISVAEGKLNVIVNKPNGSNTIEINVQDNIWDRFFGDTVFVLNIDGGAIIMKADCVYTSKSNAQNTGENRYQLYTLPQFMKFQDIDYCFESLPEEITMDSENDEKIKTQLSILEIKPAQALASLDKELKLSELLSYAETHLLIDPSEDLIEAYYVLIVKNNKLSRGLKFLSSRLDKRPVNINWHRIYQNLAKVMHKKLIPEYDKLLNPNPKSSALLYLRGRIDPNNLKAIKYYDQAISANPKNKFPCFAKIYATANMGKLNEAAHLCNKMNKLFPGSKKISGFDFYIQFSLGNYKQIKAKAEHKLQKEPLAWDAVVKLVIAETALNNKKKAKQVIDNYKQATKKEYPKFKNFNNDTEIYLAYIQNDLKNCEKLASGKNKSNNCYILLEQLKIKQAEKAISKQPDKKLTISLALEMFIAERRFGDPTKGEKWLNKAMKKLASKGEINVDILKLLSGKTADPVKQIKQRSIELFSKKALICLTMAEIYPKHSKELTELASRLNMIVSQPYYFINSVIDSRN
jgi:tetratricopeptide (TPR) repeat protein